MHSFPDGYRVLAAVILLRSIAHAKSSGSRSSRIRMELEWFARMNGFHRIEDDLEAFIRTDWFEILCAAADVDSGQVAAAIRRK